MSSQCSETSKPTKRRKHEEIDKEIDKEMDDNNKLKDKKSEENIDESDSQSQDSEGDSDDVDSDDSEDNQFINKEIKIDFSAYQPIGEDFNGIKCLLSQLWLKEKINISELTQLLIDQKHICSVLKQEEDEEEEDLKSDDEDDEDVYGVTSVIPLEDYSQKECIKQMKNTLISYLPKDNEIHKILSNSSEKIGFVVNERFVNLPPKISLPSFQQLIDDLKSAKSDEQNKLNVDFNWFLMVLKILKTKQTNTKIPKQLELIYVNAEEELFDDFCDHQFEYSVAKQCDSDVFDWKDDNNLLEPFRKVLLMTNENWNKAINKLNEEFK